MKMTYYVCNEMWLEQKQLEKKTYYLETRPTKIVNMQGLLNLFYPSSLFKKNVKL